MIPCVFNILKSCQFFYFFYFCQNAYIILSSYQYLLSVLISPRPFWHLSFSVFLITVILEHVKWYLVALLCISLKATNVEKLFTGLLAICLSSLEQCLLESFAYSKVGLSFYWVVRVLYLFWEQGRPYTFNVIIDGVWFETTILLFVYYSHFLLCFYLSFGFTELFFYDFL